MTNTLVHEKSPYLRAHAGNPVDWRPWGEDALGRARRENRPLFVSVGYSACHWCHVMAREAFSDAEVAGILNAHFVSIKVDREERPDIDRVLQVAHQALTGRGGGWPLSVFLEPESLTPFFAGTYFPLTPRYGMPGFANLLDRIVAAWREHRDDLVAQGRQLREHLVKHLGHDRAQEPSVLDDSVIEAACTGLAASFDHAHGGFGDGPRFPQAPVLGFVLTQPGAGDMLARTLQAMARGGLRDHVGGGFFRYTVDSAWRVPHFEKMLGDNAQLLGVFAEAAVRLSSDEFRQVALQTADFMEAELALPTGGYATSLNAESGGKEGSFYLWDRDEVAPILGGADTPAFMRAFGLDAAPMVAGQWHLARVDGDHGGFARELSMLRQARALRRRPDRDDKRLTRLNALAVTALSRASALLDAPALATRAVEVFDTLEATVVDGERVFACAWQGEPYQPGFLADYAFMAEAALTLAAVGGGARAVALAQRLADAILSRFRTQGGGLAVTEAGAETLLYRSRAWADDAIPAAAGVAVRVWLALGHLLAEPRYLEAVETALCAAWPDMAQAPGAHPTLLTALEAFRHPVPLVVLRGEDRMRDWVAAAWHADPRAQVFRLDVADATMPALQRYGARGSGVAYVCRGLTCSEPIDDVDALCASLRTNLDGRPGRK